MSESYVESQKDSSYFQTNMHIFRMERIYLLSTLVTFVLCALVTPSKACDPNLQPVIGILVQDLNETDLYPHTNYLAASYVKFVEMFGGRVVPILPDKEDSYYQGLSKTENMLSKSYQFRAKHHLSNIDETARAFSFEFKCNV